MARAHAQDDGAFLMTTPFKIGFILIVLFAAQVRADVIIIANNSVTEKKLERESLERIYLGKKSQWSDGSKVVPVVLKTGTVHSSFLKRYLDRDASQFSTYWKQVVFTGRGVPPKSFPNETNLVKYVNETPGAIGYVSTMPTAENVHKIDVAK